MPISLVSNTAAYTVLPHLEKATQRFTRASERLASGHRINHPSDDAAGMSRATLLEAEVRSAQQARSNATSGLSIVQIAEGGLQQTNNILMRLRELAVQGSNDSTSEQERKLLSVELDELLRELDRSAESVRFMGSPLLNGEGSEYSFQIGTGSTDNDRISLDMSQLNATADALGLTEASISSSSDAQATIESVTEAINQVQGARASMGALQTRFNYITEQLQTYEQGVSSMKSAIMDADIAKETTELLAGEIQQRSAISVLAQANIFPQLALRLLEAGLSML